MQRPPFPQKIKSGAYPVLATVSSRYSKLTGRLSTCYSPVRHFTHHRSDFRVRLACVRHAASVQSEPESNSPVNYFLTARIDLSRSTLAESLFRLSSHSSLVKEPIRSHTATLPAAFLQRSATRVILLASSPAGSQLFFSGFPRKKAEPTRLAPGSLPGGEVDLWPNT